MNDLFIDEVFFSGTQIGYTDFVKIYLNENIRGSFLEVLRKHECSHIWLQHNIRSRYIDKLDHEQWNIACDMEIAKHIYTIEDNDLINSPRSPLRGGITIIKCAEFPMCQYAEEFYAELIKCDTNKQPHNIDMSAMDLANCDAKEIQLDVENLIAVAQDKLKELQSKQQKQKQQHKINAFNSPKPSLSSEVDAIRRSRSMIKRVKSFKRPNRRESLNELFKKGYKNTLKEAYITLYVDRSGSFSSDKTMFANKKMSDTLLKYRGRIKMDTIYFNDNLLFKDPIVGSGGTNYNCVVNHINSSSSSLSVIITDDDKCDSTLVSDKKILVIPIGCGHSKIAQILACKEI